MDTSAIFQRIMADPANFLDQILSPVAHELGIDPSHLDGGEYSPEDLIAAAVGNRLAQFLGPQGPVPMNGEDLLDLSTRHDQLQARNSVLAAALGACDCWGEDPGCGICHGVGRPGSAPPISACSPSTSVPRLEPSGPRTPTARFPLPPDTRAGTKMSTPWFDELTSEAADPFTGYDPTEDFIDDFPGEGFDDMPQDTEAVSRSDHRRRQSPYYARRPSAVRRRENVPVRYPARGPYRRSAQTPIVAKAIHDTNVDSKIRDEMLAKTVAANSSRIQSLQTALAYDAAREQFEASFPEFARNPLLGILLRAGVPLFTLGKGSSSLLHNRGAWALGSVLGVALAAKALHATRIVHEFSAKIVGPTRLGVGANVRYFALAVTGDGRITDRAITFDIEPAGSVTAIDATTGAVTASANAEDITIVAKIDNQERGRLNVRIS